MLNKIFKYIFMVTLGVSMVACSDYVDTPKKELIPDSPGTVTLRFRNSERTRSQESDNSETLIESLYIALYTATADEETQPVAFESFTGLTDHTTSTVTMQLTEEMITGLFNDVGGASCRMFVLANLPAASVANLPQLPTISQMKNLEISAPFDTRKVQQSFVMSGEGTVSYTKGVTANDPGRATGAATVYRAAAKIRLNLNLPSSITITNAEGNEETWVPQRTGIQCLLSNGVKSAIASPVPVTEEAAPWEPSSDEAYYDGELSNGESVRVFSNTGTDPYSWIMDVPFYTFPNAWTESVEERHKTTITLMVAWALQGTDSYHTYYYQVPITSQELPHIDRNYSYNVNLTVGMLGSLVPEVPIVLDPLSYQVVNWNSTDVDVSIQDFRYLVVNPNVITVNNEAEVVIPFYSSHPVDVSNFTMTFQRFNFYTGTNGEVVDITIPESKLNLSTYNHEVTVNGVTQNVTDTICTYRIIRDESTNQMSLVVKHPLEIWTPVNTQNQEVSLTGRTQGTNTLTTVTNSIAKFVRPANPESPYSTYTFKLRLAHEGTSGASYYEDIQVIQYPAMYIEAKQNPGGGDSNKGNVWVNGANGTGGDYGGVHGLSSTASNKNPNMYVINISQLNTGSEFLIGDPRSEFINNTLTRNNNGSLVPTANENTAAAWDNEATALYYEGISNTRHLTYYYPTEEVAVDSPKGRMIAPKIRIASSYGVTNQLSRNNARRRVATYQEVNCPAGRWRLPTYSELLYIIQLSSSGKIPMLFNHYPNGENRENYCRYWTAQGLYRVNSDGTLTKAADTNNGGVKGIYDEWYWENSQYQLKPGTNGNYTYTLGDVPRGKQ